jgi:hypothetical protein
MVSGLAAQHALSKEVVESVTERTGGVPLFVEELTRLLLERGELGVKPFHRRSNSRLLRDWTALVQHARWRRSAR